MAEDTTKYNVPTEENLEPASSRIKRSAMSIPSLSITSGEIYEQARQELRFPQCIGIYRQMALEPILASVLSLLEILISRSEWKAVTPRGAPAEEVARAEFVNWNLKNLKRPWKEYIIEMLAYLQYGHQPMEKVYSTVTTGKHKGKVGLAKLIPISPTTISKWIFNLQTGEIAGLRQDLSRISSDFHRFSRTSIHTDIPRSKFLLLRNSAKLDNPQGNSPLNACYISWRQKTTIEDYELIGVSRDLGGIPVVGVDVEFLALASEEGSNEAMVLEELDRQAALLHAGEQAYVRKPISYDDRGNELFSFELMGVNGGGKQYSTDDIVKRLENKMLMTFLADVLKLGTEAQGSYALADSKTTLLSMGVEHNLDTIKDVLNHDLIKQIYVLNGWDYDDETSVRFEYGDIEERDLDVLSKFVQRVFSVGAVRSTKYIESWLLEQMGVEQQEEDDIEELETEMNSNSGKSDGTSGTGDSQGSGAGSSENSENKA